MISRGIHDNASQSECLLSPIVSRVSTAANLLPSAPRCLRKNIGEFLGQFVHRGCIRETGNDGLVKIVETAQFVDAVDMVRVVMCEQHVFHMLNLTVCQALLAQIGGGVDQDIVVVFTDQNRRPARRLFFGSSDKQTSQLQHMEGTPVEVPVPRNNIFMAGGQ